MGSIRAHHGWRSGVYPFIFSILQCFSRSENVKFFVFFRKCPKVVVLLQPKTKQKTSKTMYTVAQCQTAIENAKALLQDVINTAHTRDEYTQRRMIDIFTRMLKTAEYNLTIAIN